MLNMFGNKMMENGESVHEGSSRSRMEQLALRVLVEDKQEVSRGTLPSAMASITMVRERDKGVLDSVPMNVFSEHDLTVSLPSVFLCFTVTISVPPFCAREITISPSFISSFRSFRSVRLFHFWTRSVPTKRKMKISSGERKKLRDIAPLTSKHRTLLLLFRVFFYENSQANNTISRIDRGLRT